MGTYQITSFPSSVTKIKIDKQIDDNKHTWLAAVSNLFPQIYSCFNILFEYNDFARAQRPFPVKELLHSTNLEQICIYVIKHAPEAVLTVYTHTHKHTRTHTLFTCHCCLHYVGQLLCTLRTLGWYSEPFKSPCYKLACFIAKVQPQT